MTKNITLSAEEKLIEKARKRAREEHRSLNYVFRDWLYRYANGHKVRKHYEDIMNRLKYASPGKHFSRDEMNER